MFWFILFIVLALVLFAVYQKKSDVKEGRGEETVQAVGQHAVEELPEA